MVLRVADICAKIKNTEVYIAQIVTKLQMGLKRMVITL